MVKFSLFASLTNTPAIARHLSGRAVAAMLLLACAGSAWAHGDVTPQAVDTSKLPPVGKEWKSTNPYRGNKDAIAVGTSGYNQNCARCHGLEAVSGGIAPDLRKLDADCTSLADVKKRAACIDEMDNFYVETVKRGRTRNGAVYMPPFEDILSQEAMWAIKAYLETRRVQ